MGATEYPVFTIGHSNHPPEVFLGLLRQHSVSEVVDVRSSPYSRYASQFNHDVLENILRKAGIDFESQGGVLGGRPADASCYDTDGRVKYDLVSEMDWFDDGIRFLMHRADERQIALMCTEKEPLECHRTLLVARALVERGVDVEHILADGSREGHDAAMGRLMDAFKLPHDGDMFWSRTDVINEAISRQSKKMAYVGSKPAADYDHIAAF